MDMVVPTKFRRLCKLCSYRNIEKKQYGKVKKVKKGDKKGEPNTKTFQISDNGLVCSRCSGLTCADCMKLIIPVLRKDSHKHVNTDLLDAYVSAVRMLPSAILSPSNFVGHCCNIDSNLAEMGSDDISEEAVPDIWASNPKLLSSSDARLSGCIHFPEFDLFIDSPVQCTGIHAVGAEFHAAKINKRKRKKLDCPMLRASKGAVYLPARWHCVISDSHARQNNQFAPECNGPVPANWRLQLISNVKIKIPYNDKVEKVSYIIRSTLHHSVVINVLINFCFYM